MTEVTFKKYIKLGPVLAISLLASCVSTPENQAPSLTEILDSKIIRSEPERLAAEGISYLEEDRLFEALKAFNAALRLNPRHATLNFFTGLTYHLLALKGDDTQFALAKQGYQRAIQADRSNWVSYFYAGLLELDLRQFDEAQTFFAQALVYNDQEPDLLYSMIVASYYRGDIQTAGALLDQLEQYEPTSKRFLQSAAIINAALDRMEKASAYKKQLRDLHQGKAQVSNLSKRLEDWKKFHKRYADQLVLPQPDPQISSTDTRQEKQPWKNTPLSAFPASPPKDVDVSPLDEQQDNSSEKDENQMVIVDVVIIRTEEQSSTTKGVNLLNGLTLELGSNNQSTSGLAFGDSVSKTVGSSTKTITRALNIPSITYSLNIANTNSSRNEILARPTLTATNGAQSEFFSGVTIKAQTLPSTAGGTGEAVQIEQDVGVKLGITPELQEDGRVKLAVTAERTFLNTPNSNIVGYTSKVETSRTTVNATVVLNFGETLILSGLSEKETERTRDQVPMLGDVPVLQYFFNKRTTNDFNKSVLLLITPRLPEYLYQNSMAKNSTQTSNVALNEFRSRYSDWFKPYPNWASIFYQMQGNTLYREFRTGDVTLERWDSDERYLTRLGRMLDFLYY